MRLERLSLTEVPLRLKHEFRTSGGATTTRRVLLVRVYSGGVAGVAECVAAEDPSYSHETTESAWAMISEFIAPTIIGKRFASADELLDSLAFIRGNDMAVAAVEMAFWDLKARALGVPLYQALGGALKPVPVGVSLGIQESVERTVRLAEEAVEQGYRRVKLKIAPGWDVKVVRAVRGALPETPLTVDANSAYSLLDAHTLSELDEFALDYMEQPLAHDDLLDHAELQARVTTPICLDESVTSARSARQALQLGAARVINLKVGRVRGLPSAMRVHDVAEAFGAPVWCGGMLESGVGRAFNLHLSTLPNFRLPGDTSSSSRYWEVDLINEPLEAVDGFQAVPQNGPGSGVTLNEELIARTAVRSREWRA